MIEKPPLSPAPRAVPASLAWRITLGGLLPLIGWSTLAFGGFMATIFVSQSELATWFRFSTELAVTQGEVVSTAGTNMHSNGQEAQRVTFVYEVQGQSYQSESYCFTHVPQEGDAVEIEYALADPATARIQGMRTAAFPAIIGLVLIFPGIGLLLVLLGVLRGRGRIALMREGTSAWGLLTDRTPTNTRINNATVFELEFSFVDEQGQKGVATDRSHRSEYFDADTPRHVLQHPDTGKSCIVELLPGKPQIHNLQWQAASAGQLARVLILPVVAAVLIWAARLIQF